MRRTVAATLALLLSTAIAHAANFQPEWHYPLPQRKVAWQYTPQMPRDSAYPFALHDNTLLLACEHNNALVALDLVTGKERWKFHTNGPLRTTPVIAGNRVLTTSDDGHLYCLDVADGKLQWRVRGGPNDRKVIAHERLAAAWPGSARPAVKDGTACFVAGYWPLEGIFVHAVDLNTGKTKWTNGNGQFRPTGMLRIAGETLFADGHAGNGAFNLATGETVQDKPPVPTPQPDPAGLVDGTDRILPDVPARISATYHFKDRTVVITETGVLSFAPGAQAKSESLRAPLKGDTAAATKLLDATRVTEGYCIVAGLKEGDLVAGLLQSSRLHIVALDADAAKIDEIRRRFDAAGLFDAHRLTILQLDPATASLPPYIASLITSENPAPIPQSLHENLRPYGGILAQPAGSDYKLTRRDGPLPGADDWTHEYGDPTNRLCSRDTRIKAPLGLLWYGGPAAQQRLYIDGYIDHHSGDGVNPLPPGALIAEGRMLLQGPGVLAAFDIYTGRPLWESPLPKLHIWGGKGNGIGTNGIHKEPMKAEIANEAEVKAFQRARTSGFNFAACADSSYTCAGPNLLRHDLTTGKQLSAWKVPVQKDGHYWGTVRIVGDLLVATVFDSQFLIDAKAGSDGNGGEWSKDQMPMSHLVVLDRKTGEVRWTRAATMGIGNRGHAVSNDTIFAVDSLPSNSLENLKQAGRKITGQPAIYALDLRTGSVKWQHELEVLVKEIAYSAEHDIVVAPCRNLTVWKDEDGGKWVNPEQKVGSKIITGKNAPGKMFGFQGKDGKVLWEVTDSIYTEPFIVLADRLIARNTMAFELLTGKRETRNNPLTAAAESFILPKGGCNHLVGSDFLLTWRIGFYDMATGAGSTRLTGMDSGCTASLIPAGGLLNIPNFGTHHKRNRMTAMAMVHVPENLQWLRFPVSKDKPAQDAQVLQAGYMFAAPGDRIDSNGTLWQGITSVRNSANVTIAPADIRSFYTHPLIAGGTEGCSGFIGITHVTVPTMVTIGKSKPDNVTRKYDVRLIFAEPEPRKPGERIFNILIEGTLVAENLDIAANLPANDRALIKEFKNLDIKGALDLELQPIKGDPVLSAVELRAVK